MKANHEFESFDENWVMAGAALGALVGTLIAASYYEALAIAEIASTIVAGALVGGAMGHFANKVVRDTGGRRRDDADWTEGFSDFDTD